jgi:hypothetical protein
LCDSNLRDHGYGIFSWNLNPFEALMPMLERGCIVLLLAMLAPACVTRLARRSSCETDAQAFLGEARRMPDGTFVYFDGHCWTTKPVPPTDTGR